VSPGDKVTVKVLEVNLEKTQMALTMRFDEKPTQKSSKAPQKPMEPKSLSVSYAGDIARQIQARSNAAPKPRPQPSANAHQVQATRPQPRPQSQQHQHKKPTPTPAFNNAFAGLAALKDQLKK